MYEEKVDAAVTDRVAKMVDKRRREDPLFYRFLPTYVPLSLVNLKHISCRVLHSEITRTSW